MSASIVTATVVAIYFAVGASTVNDIPQLAVDGSILEEQCGTTHHCDFDDGSPECARDKARGLRCERDLGRLERMRWQKEAEEAERPQHPDKWCTWDRHGVKRCSQPPPHEIPDRFLSKQLLAPELVTSDQPTSIREGGWWWKLQL